MLTVTMQWDGGIRFTGQSAFGHTIVTDTSSAAGGTEAGFKPTELLLYGIAACTGVDVVRILEKQRQELTALEISVVGQQGDDYPRPFHTIEVTYTARGRNLNPDKVARAIALSEEKYCSVSLTVKHETELKTSFRVIEET